MVIRLLIAKEGLASKHAKNRIDIEDSKKTAVCLGGVLTCCIAVS